VCILLYIYSIEPPFYAELNKAARTKDTSKLETLGPYARAIHVVLINGEISERKRADKLKQGIDNGRKGPHGLFSQSFLLFRGVLLPQVWLKDWTSQEGGDFVRMPTLTSSSQSIEIAL